MRELWKLKERHFGSLVVIGVRCWAIFWILLSGQNAHPSRSVRHCSSLISISYCPGLLPWETKDGWAEPKRWVRPAPILNQKCTNTYTISISFGSCDKAAQIGRDLTQRGPGTMMLVHGGWHAWVALLACGAPEETVGMFSLHDRIEEIRSMIWLTQWCLCSLIHFFKIAGFQRIKMTEKRDRCKAES